MITWYVGLKYGMLGWNVVLLENKLDICNKCDIYVKRVVDRHTSPEGDWSPSMTVKLLIDGLTFFLTLIQDMYIKLCEITKSSTVRLVKVYCYELPDLEHPEILDLCETIELYLEQEISLLEMNIMSLIVWRHESDRLFYSPDYKCIINLFLFKIWNVKWNSKRDDTHKLIPRATSV